MWACQMHGMSKRNERIATTAKLCRKKLMAALTASGSTGSSARLDCIGIRRDATFYTGRLSARREQWRPAGRGGQQNHRGRHRYPELPVLAAESSAKRSVRDRKSTRLNSSHLVISYAVFCLKKKKRIH